MWQNFNQFHIHFCEVDDDCDDVTFLQKNVYAWCVDILLTMNE